MPKQEFGSLKLRCEPSIDESVFGYLTRVAQRNGDQRVHPYIEAAGLGTTQRWFSDDDVYRICEFTLAAENPRNAEFSATIRAIAPSNLRSHGDVVLTKVHGKEIPAELLFMDGHRRVCPHCLTKPNPVHRLAWDFKVMQACSEHKIRLAVQCPHPECEKKAYLDWRTGDVRKCSNGHDLGVIECPTATEEDLISVRFFEGLIFGDQELPPLLQGLPLWAVMDVLLHAPDFGMAVRKLLFPDPPDPGLEKQFGDWQPYGGELGRAEPPADLARRLSMGVLIMTRPVDRIVTALEPDAKRVGSPTHRTLMKFKFGLRGNEYVDTAFVRMVTRVLEG